MATSDGIDAHDWAEVLELAAEVVNHADSPQEAWSRRRLMRALDELERRYGRLPSILSTRADFSVDVAFSLSLLKEAYASAGEMSDFKNKVFISASLAELYLDTFSDRERARYWVEMLGEDLGNYADDEYFVELHEGLMARVANDPDNSDAYKPIV